MADALTLLEPVQTEYPATSMADIIVLAGLAAVEMAGGNEMKFCGGRVDAEDGDGVPDHLAPRIYDPMVLSVRDWIQVAGLTPDEGVALMARPKGSSMTLSNQFFLDLKAAGAGSSFSPMELALLEPEFMPIVEKYAADDAMFKSMFAQAWTKMMIADRFDGPVNNPCDGVDDTMRASPSSDEGAPDTSGSSSIVATFSLTAAAVAVAASALFI